MYGLQEKKKNSFEIYRKCYEYHPFPVLIIDADDKSIVHANKSAHDFFKFGKQAFKNFNLSDLNFTPICNNNGSSKKTTIYKFIDGSERYAEIFEKNFKIENKLYTGLFIHEITEIKLLQKKLLLYKNELSELTDNGQLTNKLKKEKPSASRTLDQKLKNALEKEKKLNEIKSRLLSTSSHEFRTPLTTILTSSELLLMVGRSWPEAKYLEQIIKIQNAVTYMTVLLDDILSINRTDREVWKFNPSMVNLNDLCRKMADDASNLATPKFNINYSYLLNSRHAIVDEKLLQHIISNLLSNAVKYSPEGGEVNFKVEQSPSNLIFTVSDHGIGIPEQDKDDLFETFYRCRNASHIKGTGLGLAIVKRSVESHGGKIKFSSRINEGSTFVVSIPLMTSI